MNQTRTVIPLSLIFGLVVIFYIRYENAVVSHFLTEEDGLIENLSAIFYLTGFVTSVIATFRNQSILLPIVCAVACFFLFGEETSWLQRLFDYHISFIENENQQQEFNLHNLYAVTGGHLTDISNGFELNTLLNVLKDSQTLFQIAFFCYFIILPFALYIPKINTLVLNTGYKKTDIRFSLVILLVIALSFFLVFNCPPDIKHNIAETREMLYAYFIMIYVTFYI